MPVRRHVNERAELYQVPGSDWLTENRMVPVADIGEVKVKEKDAKPCPFCGTKPKMEPWHGGGPNKHRIGCQSIRCDASPSVTGESPDEARRRWNKRSVRFVKGQLPTG